VCGARWRVSSSAKGAFSRGGGGVFTRQLARRPLPECSHPPPRGGASPGRGAVPEPPSRTPQQHKTEHRTTQDTEHRTQRGPASCRLLPLELEPQPPVDHQSPIANRQSPIAAHGTLRIGRSQTTKGRYHTTAARMIPRVPRPAAPGPTTNATGLWIPQICRFKGEVQVHRPPPGRSK
jgi:hypothetical protein